MSTSPLRTSPFSRRLSLRGAIGAGLVQLLLLGYAALVVYPLVLMVVSSLKTTGEIFRNPLSLIPSQLRFSNYTDAWYQANFGTYFKNSVVVSIVSVLIILFFGSMAAYVLARFRFRGSNLVFLLFLAGFMIPIRLAIIPLFILMRDLRLLDTLWSLIAIYVAGGMPFTVFLLVSFFRRIPRDLEDAALIDGANPFQIYYRVMLPLVRPAVATVGLFHFLNIWNDFFFPLIFIRSDSLRTVPLGISVFFGEYSNNWALLFAGLSISIVPVIVLYLFTSRQFISGLTAGAVKLGSASREQSLPRAYRLYDRVEGDQGGVRKGPPVGTALGPVEGCSRGSRLAQRGAARSPDEPRGPARAVLRRCRPRPTSQRGDLSQGVWAFI